MDHLTRFPALNVADGAVHARSTWPVDTAALPTELLAISWAYLLHSFTTEETPVFLLNGSPIKVDLFARSIRPATLDAVSELSTKHTAVFVGDWVAPDPSNPCALTWILNPESQTSTFHSNTAIDAVILHQLDSRLKQILQDQASNSDRQARRLVSEPLLPTMSVSNPSPCTLPGPQLLHKLALRHCRKSHSVAIEFLAADGKIRCLSYYSLDRLSSKLAAAIIHASRKVDHDAQKMVVPVLLPQSLELYVTWLAILKAGGAFCPLNIDAPPERIEFILQDVAASVTITQGTLAARLPQNEHLAVINADESELNNDEDTIEPTVDISPSDLAYVMYTSGSTGRPKGVGVSHLAATQSLLAHDDLIPHFSRFLQFASPTFDVSVFEVFFPLMRGATLVGSEREQMLLDISHVMTEMKVDAAELTPTVAGELLRTRAAAPSLRVLLTIGEMLTKHVVEEFGQSNNSPGILHGMYGPTEAAIHCTAATNFQSAARVNLIGKPFKTVSAFIMPFPPGDTSGSQDLQPLPRGEIGELVVGGPQLADGYINRPEENSKAFVESSAYGRLYRTGDKARMLLSGEIECFGRISNGQVKIRGQRIELGEIEHVICKAPNVRSVVAIVSEGSLAAFVLVNDKGTTDYELRHICRQWLPRFMVPGEFLIVNQFPQLPSGKVDRKALEAEFIRHRNAAHSVDQHSFRDETEEMLASCVADVLGRQISSAESLVSAGLDSLGAIRVASHLLDAGIRLDVARVLEADSIDGIWQLAKELDTTPSIENGQTDLRRIHQLVANAGATRIESLGLSSQIAEIEPCSHIQQAMILETTRHTKAYCNWVELEFQSSIKTTAVQDALIKILEQNKLLRSGFVEVGLKDHPYARVTWKALDEQFIQKHDVFEYDLPLMVENDLLHPFRIQLKTTEEGARMVVHIHHALYDGWSWQLILKDLHRLLQSEEILPKPAYNVVTNFFMNFKLDESSNQSSVFWRDQLQGSSVAAFPTFNSKTSLSPETQEATRALNIPVSNLNDVSQRLKVSRQTIFQAAFCYVLSSYICSDDVVFGTVFSGRTLPIKGIETVIGPCIRTLPTRMSLNKMQTVTDLLMAIQNMNRKSLEYGSLPLQDIKKASGIGLDQNLFDTALVWQETLWSNEAQGTLFKEVDSAEFLEFALLLEFEPRPGRVYAKATYQESILPYEQAHILLEQIDCVASILIDNPSIPINDIGGLLPLSTLSVFNSRFETQINRSSLVSGVESIAFVEPTRTAVEILIPRDEISLATEIQSVSYAELNDEANRLAHYLLNKGVKPSNLTAIFLDKSIEYYVSILAIAKIGAGLLLLAPWDSSRSIGSTLIDANVQFCIVYPSTPQIDAPDTLASISQILLPDSLEDQSDINLPTIHDSFYIVSTERPSSNNECMTHAYMSHRNLQSHINVLSDSYQTASDCKMLQSSISASPDSIIEAFFAWHAGMTLCSTPDIILPKNVSHIVNTMKITHLHLTPTLASFLTPDQVPSVRYLLTSGEPLTAKVHQNWAEKGLNYAGICTICPGFKASTHLTNMGTPLQNTSVMIVADKEPFTLLPRGALGKLCFGGDQVGRIISGSKPMTMGNFIDHPEFGQLYKTGDSGRLLPDGSILIVSGGERADLRGQLISLNEIDSALISSELVQNSLSIILRDPMTNLEQLATIWIPSALGQKSLESGELDISRKDLLQLLISKLSPSKIPSLLVSMDELPITEFQRTDFEKIKCEIEQMDRKKISLCPLAYTVDEFEDNLTDIEKTIISCLSETTGIDEQNIHKHTSFYKLGLDSLSAIAFSQKLQESGFERLAVSQILRYSSVTQLATVVHVTTNRHSPENQTRLYSTSVFDENFLHEVANDHSSRNTSVQGIYPCTPLQEAMLAAESDVSSAYFNHIMLRVNADTQAMKAAWTEMLRRHEILRTCFRPTNHKGFAYAQVVLGNATLPWSSMEVRDRLEEDVKRRKSDFESQSPVNGKLPYSLTMFTDFTTHHKHLLLSIHHALYDGEGISQLLHEVQLALGGQELPEVNPFHQFIEYMISTRPDESDQFWERYLSGVSPIQLSRSDGANSRAEQFASRQIHVEVKNSLHLFKEQCKELSVSPLNVFHAAWTRLLASYADSSDICFGNVFSSRTVPLEGADRIVGPCFNTLPIRVKLSPTSTNADVMRLTQKQNNDILPHQLTPLRRVQSRVQSGGSQLFDTLVILQTSGTNLDARYWELLEDEGNMGLPLICEIVPDEACNTIGICFHFQPFRLTEPTAEQLAHNFVTLLEHTIQYPSAQASDKQSFGAHIPQLFEKLRTRSTISPPLSSNFQVSRPWSYQEEALRDLLCKLSGVDPEAVFLHTTIFQLGLDSINSVQISGRLRRLGYKISAGDILEAASIEKIASLLGSSERGHKEDEFDFSSFQADHLQPVCEQLGISPETVQYLRPCTPVQNGMLALFTTSHGKTYFNEITLKLPTPLDKELLKNAWSKVVARHEMLRTGFVQLRDKQYPFAMITYQGNWEIPWHEAVDIGTVEPYQLERQDLGNLHQPPWQITVEASDAVTLMRFSALHALYDAQSLQSIFSDVVSAYTGQEFAKPASINATLGPILIESQKQSQTSREFWQDLAPGINPSKFPDLHPIRTENKTLLTSSIRCSQGLPALEKACRVIGVTLQAAGQAAWARLLSAYSGEQSVTFGTVLSGRNLSAAAQEAVFPCLVTLPLPSRIEGTNRELLDRTMKQNASLVKNQFTPLSQVQRWLSDNEPLFDTLFVYQKFVAPTNDPEPWEIIDEETKIDACYPVSIELIPRATDLEVRISYRSDVLPKEQARLLLNQYDKMLENVVLSPYSNADDYSFLEDQWLSITPAKEKTLPSSVSLLHQFVEYNALRIPDKTAFEFTDGSSASSLHKRTWSYRSFDEDGNRVAHFLQSKGINPGDMVAICFDKCPVAYMAILGILKAGCAYLAIDPTAPISRKQFIMEDSDSHILLCNQARRADLEGLSSVDVQTLDEPDLLQNFSGTQPVLSRSIQPGDTCYCLYTSGTTGTPKGCEITHDNAVQAMLAFQRLFVPHWDEDSRWLQFASFHFDVSVLEQYWSWSVGICVTSCPRDLLFEDLPGTIDKLQITHIDLTPSLARLVHPEEVPSLCRGVFITGGEQLKQEILDAWGRHGVIYNGYGPTEVTIGCTMLPRMRANDKPSNIGPQFDNVGSYVFRPGTSTPVLRGGLGELCVSGPLVGKGYLNRAELTKERFQVLPDYRDRIYRTGDLVRILHDGSFQFQGRVDDQIKLRGQRLEVGEINEVIKKAALEVNEVATLVLKHPKQSKDQLVSFITRIDTYNKSCDLEGCASDHDRVLLSIVKSTCHAHLPGYMVPTHIILLNQFPLSANNKADMKVLKSLYEKLSLEEIQNISAMTVGHTTKNEREKEIISVLSDFIGTRESTIAPWSSIYELGLDSISVISFSRILRETGFPNAYPSLIMKHSTIRGMASALQAAPRLSISVENLHKNAQQAMQAFAHKQSHTVCESIGVTESDVEEVAPCTPLQEGIIYHFLSSSLPLYCSSFTFELDSSINPVKLQSAWSQAQSQVQILRARFSPSPDGYAQVVLKTDTLPWFHIEVPPNEMEISRRQQRDKWVSSIDGLSAPLWEVGLVTSPGTSMMCLNMFHGIYDGNSLSLLLELVARNYLDQQMASERTPQFLDVLHIGPLCKDPSAEAFWKEHLVDCRPRALATPDQETGEYLSQQIEIRTTESLDHLRKALNVTEQAVLHACWLLTLHQHYRFVPPLGIIASGRTSDIPGIAEVIGPLFNTIPSNIQLLGLKSWSEVAKRCHEYHVSTIPFQYTPLRDVVKWLGKKPDERLFDSLFVFQRENAQSNSLASKLWNPRDSEAQHEYPLAFEIVRSRNETLVATLAVRSHVMSSKEAQQVLMAFERALSDFAQHPNRELPQADAVAEDTHVYTNGDVTFKPSESAISTGSSDTSLFQWTSQAYTVRDVIANLAGVDAQSVGEETSIFEVGLDSIDAIKLSSRLSKLDIKLPVSAIMRHRNVKAMISQLAAEDHLEQEDLYPRLGYLEKELRKFLENEGILPQSACRILPATPIQEAMIAEMSASRYQHYYNHEVLQVGPDVDITKLQEAWRTVVKSHPILRTSFIEVWDPEIPASYAQIVHNDDAFDLRIVHLDGASIDSMIELQRVRASTEFANCAHLTVTVAVDGDTHFIILSIAHALYDGWSINLLHEDVARSYAGEDCTRPPPDAVLEKILASSGEQALKFWRANLLNSTPTSFPSGKDAKSGSKRVHRAEAPLSVSLDKAEAFCKRHGLTMQALLAGCWSIVLATYVKRLDVIFGLVLLGRNVANSENVMFPTMNTVAMRVILHGTRLELMKYVQETMIEISEHQHFPLRRMRLDAKSQQLFDTIFIYQKRPRESEVTRRPLYKSVGGASNVDYPVCAEVEGVGEHLIGRVACRGSVLGEKDTLALLDRMADILLSIVDGPGQQTVDFAGDSMKISRYSVLQDASKEVVTNDIPPRAFHREDWSPTESKIRSVLSVVSGVPKESIGKEANIFQLGLDSISAIKVAALLKKQSVKLVVSDLLRAGTIEKMAGAANNYNLELTKLQVADSLKESLSGIQALPLAESYGIESHQIQKMMPATAGQIYFLAMHALKPELFYPQFCYLATKNLSPEILNNAWARLSEETPILRTTFLPTEEPHRLPYVQILLKSVHNGVNWHKHLGNQVTLAKTKRGFGSVPVSLHASQTTGGTVLLLQIHHALYDAVSLPYMITRLVRLCSPAAPESKFDVNDISQLVAVQRHSPVDIRRLFWQKYLSSVPSIEGSAKRTGTFGVIQPYYHPSLVPNMSRVALAAKRQGLSTQSIFLAVYARVYAQTLAASGTNSQEIQRQLVVGLYLANRSLVAEGLSELIAPTVNIVPLRLDDKLNDRHGSLFVAARQIQEEINEISRIEHASVSLIEIAEWTGVRISTCVNFLRLPESEESSRTGATDEIFFKSISHMEVAELETTSSEIVQSEINDDPAAFPAIAETTHPAASLAAIEDVFLPTIDVEAAIRNDRLDFGLFGSDDRLGRPTAEKIVEELQQQFIALIESLEVV
ncbi:uncharacterized protein N7459_002105 [Penicillium hispanicum]|uniref:uncharacterized protein n=1 Tax=Penicillium hispanicum TaxID=1080232 RepID=UPI0025408237|nr:uncharacterized protein N7459_002105 [Penicillium hispanicum]KAJ5591736.1 hypothetical protein N7459_002105 [Penicillium hispanicum]